ncbi:MAG: hypothetical protein OEZ22_03780 [Spirochaetia bacterium]|nr:hypothetical protein [Spirochaetia bacterium]
MPYLAGFITGLAVSFLASFINRKLAKKKESISAWQGWSVGYYIRLTGLMAVGFTVFVLNRKELIDSKMAFSFFLAFCGAIAVGMITDVIVSVKRLK